MPNLTHKTIHTLTLKKSLHAKYTDLFVFPPRPDAKGYIKEQPPVAVLLGGSNAYYKFTLRDVGVFWIDSTNTLYAPA